MRNDRFITITNGSTKLIIDRLGAQIVSYIVDGVQIMYQGALNPDNAMWKATAKNLFPNPGPIGSNNDVYGELKVEEYSVNDKNEKHTIYIHNGGLYHMGQHGFAQSKLFNVKAKKPSYAVLSLSSATHQTYTEYPYEYVYNLMIDLPTKNSFHYLTSVQNVDQKPILAGMGWHPAFRLHHSAQKYKIRFRNLVKNEQCELEEHVYYDIYDSVIAKSKSKIISGIISADIELCYEIEPGRFIPYITMHTEEPYLILWSKNREQASQEEFICIEPWNCPPRMISKLTTQDKTESLKNEGAVVVDSNQRSVLEAIVFVNPEYTKTLCYTEEKKK